MACQIAALTQDNYIDFLASTPPIGKLSVVKAKTFKAVCKALCKRTFQHSDVNIYQKFNKMTSNYYNKCFSNTLFKGEFNQTVADECVLNKIVKRCKHKFVQKVEQWIEKMMKQQLNGSSRLKIERLGVNLTMSREELVIGINEFMPQTH